MIRWRLHDPPVDFGNCYEFLPGDFLIFPPLLSSTWIATSVSAWRTGIQSWALQGWDHLHPGAHSLAEILMGMDSRLHHGQLCGRTGLWGSLALCTLFIVLLGHKGCFGLYNFTSY